MIVWLKIAVAFIKQVIHIWLEDDPGCKKQTLRKEKTIIKISCECGEVFYQSSKG